MAKTDLKLQAAQCALSVKRRKGNNQNEFWADCFFSTNGVCTGAGVSKVRRALSWQLQGEELFLLGSVSMHGFCATDLSGKLARYRGLLARIGRQTLPHGYSRPGVARIKAFYGTSINAVKTQIWIAITVYVLVAIVKKRLNLKQSLYTILQIFSIALFEKTPILQVFSEQEDQSQNLESCKQLVLFD